MSTYMKFSEFKTKCALKMNNMVRTIAVTNSDPCFAAIGVGPKMYLYQDRLELHSVSSGKSSSDFTSSSFRFDNELLFCGTSTGDVMAVQGNKILRTISAHKGSVHQVRAMAQLTSCVSSGADCTVKVWDVPTGESIHTFTHKVDDALQPVKAVQCSRNNPHLLYAGCAGGMLRLYDTRLSQHVRQWEHGYAISCIALANSEACVYVGGDSWVRGWTLLSASISSADSQLCLYRRHNQLVTNLQLTADDDFIISSGLDSLVRVCRTLDLTQVHQWEMDSGVVAMALYSPSVTVPNPDEGCVRSRNRLWLGCDDGTVVMKLHRLPRYLLQPTLTHSKQDDDTRPFTVREHRRLLAIEKSLKLGILVPQDVEAEEDVTVSRVVHRANTRPELPTRKLLRKFRHTEALKTALTKCKPKKGNCNIAPFARVLEELHRRKCLQTAVIMLPDELKSQLKRIVREYLHHPDYIDVMLLMGHYLGDVFSSKNDLQYLDAFLHCYSAPLPSLS